MGAKKYTPQFFKGKSYEEPSNRCDRDDTFLYAIKAIYVNGANSQPNNVDPKIKPILKEIRDLIEFKYKIKEFNELEKTIALDYVKSIEERPLEISESLDKKTGGLLRIVYYTQRIPGHSINGHSLFSKLKNEPILDEYTSLETKILKEVGLYSKREHESREYEYTNENKKNKKTIKKIFKPAKGVYVSNDFVSNVFGKLMDIKNFQYIEKQFRQAILDATAVWFDKITELANGELSYMKAPNFKYDYEISNLIDREFRADIYKRYYDIDISHKKYLSFFGDFYKSSILSLIDEPLFGYTFFNILNKWLRERGQEITKQEARQIIIGSIIGGEMDMYPGLRVKTRKKFNIEMGGGACCVYDLKKLKSIIKQKVDKKIKYSHEQKKFQSSLMELKKNINKYLDDGNKIKIKKIPNDKEINSFFISITSNLEEVIENALYKHEEVKLEEVLRQKTTLEKEYVELKKKEILMERIVDEEVRDFTSWLSRLEHDDEEINILKRKRIILPKNDTAVISKSIDRVSGYVRIKIGTGVCDDAAMINAGLVYGPLATVGVFILDTFDTLDKMSFIYNKNGKDESVSNELKKRNGWLENAIDEESLTEIIGLSAVNIGPKEKNINGFKGHSSQLYLNTTPFGNKIGVGFNAILNHFYFVMRYYGYLRKIKSQHDHIHYERLKRTIKKGVDSTIKLGFRKMKYPEFIDEIISRLEYFNNEYDLKIKEGLMIDNLNEIEGADKLKKILRETILKKEKYNINLHLLMPGLTSIKPKREDVKKIQRKKEFEMFKKELIEKNKKIRKKLRRKRKNRSQ